MEFGSGDMLDIQMTDVIYDHCVGKSCIVNGDSIKFRKRFNHWIDLSLAFNKKKESGGTPATEYLIL